MLLDAVIPPQVNADDARGHGEVEADTPAFQGGNHDLIVNIVTEGGDGVVTSVVGHFTMVTSVTPATLVE